MRVVLISDTHGMHKDVTVPNGDILVHAGDITMFGEGVQVRSFNEWAKILPHRLKICTLGNHDVFGELTADGYQETLTEWQCLVDELFVDTVSGLRFYGSPYTPEFGGDRWNYQLYGANQRIAKWSAIPHDLDFLITHGPAFGILDKTLEGDFVGDPDLQHAILRTNTKRHVCGHIHEGYGQVTRFAYDFYNASICTRMYKPT